MNESYEAWEQATNSAARNPSYLLTNPAPSNQIYGISPHNANIHNRSHNLFEDQQDVESSYHVLNIPKVQTIDKIKAKPLMIMNIDIGESKPKKVYIYEDTDPNQKAYEFVDSNDLPEEMVPTVASLINQNKQRILTEREKQARLQAEELRRVAQKPRPFLEYKNNHQERRNSVGSRQSDSLRTTPRSYGRRSSSQNNIHQYKPYKPIKSNTNRRNLNLPPKQAIRNEPQLNLRERPSRNERRSFRQYTPSRTNTRSHSNHMYSRYTPRGQEEVTKPVEQKIAPVLKPYGSIHSPSNEQVETTESLLSINQEDIDSPKSNQLKIAEESIGDEPNVLKMPVSIQTPPHPGINSIRSASRETDPRLLHFQESKNLPSMSNTLTTPSSIATEKTEQTPPNKKGASENTSTLNPFLNSNQENSNLQRKKESTFLGLKDSRRPLQSQNQHSFGTPTIRAPGQNTLKPKIGEIGPSQMFSPLYQQEIEYSRRVEKSILDQKRKKRSQSQTPSQGIFDHYAIEKKTSTKNDSNDELFKENEHDISKIAGDGETKNDYETGEFIKQYGYSDEESGIFDTGQGSRKSKNKDSKESHLPVLALTNTNGTGSNTKQTYSRKNSVGNNNYRVSMDKTSSQNSTNKPIMQRSYSARGLLNQADRTNTQSSYNQRKNKYTPGNKKYRFRMSPKVNPASTKRMIERMTQKIGGRQNVEDGSRRASREGQAIKRSYSQGYQGSNNQQNRDYTYQEPFQNARMSSERRQSLQNQENLPSGKQQFMFDSYATYHAKSPQSGRIAPPQQAVLQNPAMREIQTYTPAQQPQQESQVSFNNTTVSKNKVFQLKSKSGVFFNPHNEDNLMLEKIFDKLDNEGKGKIRSYDVYLSNLRVEQKNLIHGILEGVNNGGMFVSMDFEMFAKVVKSSGKLSQVKDAFEY